jgi:hypothetical protein
MIGPESDVTTTQGRRTSRFRGRPTWRDPRLLRLATRLPGGMRRAVYRLRQPSVRWIRLPAGILLMIGGVVLLPVPPFVSWMLPVGFVLVAEDIPFARNCVVRILDTIERRKPEWLRRRRK